MTMSTITYEKAATPFEADLARFDLAFRTLDAIRVEPDGFAWVEAARVPAELMRVYRRLIEYGYATGQLP